MSLSDSDSGGEIVIDVEVGGRFTCIDLCF